MKYVLLIAALSFAVFMVPRSQAFAATGDSVAEENSPGVSPLIDDANISTDLVRPGGGGGGGHPGGGGGGHGGGGGGHPGGGGGGHVGGGGGHPGGGGGGHVGGGGGHVGGGDHGGGHVSGGMHGGTYHGGDYHVGHGYGGGGFRDGYRAGRFGWHGGVFIGYPGWYAGWGWDYDWFPFWYTSTILWPEWVWEAEAPVGYYQCTAFNQQLQPFSAVGPDMQQATYGALQLCADGGDPQTSGCYIPQGYCRLH